MKSHLLMTMVLILGVSTFANDMGAAAAEKQSGFSLEEMLKYAIEDEYLALAEYEAIMESFGELRPYTNIAESEKTHIKYLNELYSAYNLKVPNVNTDGHIAVPETLAEAAEIGVEAEIANIAMYDRFLSQELPDDVRDVFTRLKSASENHLKAFQRQFSANGSNRNGNGRNRKR